ncbi:FecR family protein [Chitinophaga silvatica]|uniref:FecR family protein n=1 Tax=Chitinophaga silvatica TaxID=2282649 RepID=A0A3E1Y6I4_9BACT|nr:FecR family protein [Chitinophaga silvatica]RFS20527.1 FecR family protein [Chitinophaga silvatica]
MQDLKILLQKYFNGECSEEEKNELLVLLEQQPDLLDKYFDEELPAENEVELPSVAASANMKAAILKATVPVVPISNGRSNAWKWWAAAAVLLLAGAGFYLVNQPAITKPMATNIDSPAKIATDTTIINQGHDSQLITLKDGSWIKLSPASHVKFSIDFLKNRHITLKGSAVFDVARDDKHPFSVTTNEIVTTALGTRFGIETGKGNTVSITLLQGKVQVTGTHMQQVFKPVVLLPGDMFNVKEQVPGIQVARAVPVPKANKIVVQNTTVITDSTFNFHNEKLLNVIKSLQAYYNESVTMPAVSDKATFTGEFNKTESFSNIIQVLADLNNLNIEKHDSTIILSTK